MAADDEQVLLSYDEAAALLPDGERVHTFLDGGLALIGADWDRADILALLREADCLEVTGPQAQAMGHGLVAWRTTDGRQQPVFIETRAQEEA